jgi:hypothetical protein
LYDRLQHQTRLDEQALSADCEISITPFFFLNVFSAAVLQRCGRARRVCAGDVGDGTAMRRLTPLSQAARPRSFFRRALFWL